MFDWRHRATGVAARLTSAAAVATVGLLTLLAPATPAYGQSTPDVAPLDEMDVLAVRTGEPTEVLFAAPARLMTRTLTSDDVTATVDGIEQAVRLQRLLAADLELVVAVDTTVDADTLLRLQSAIVELALNLPPGATMQIVDGTGRAAGPAAVPGPAIAQIQQLQPTSDDNLQRAVDEAQTLLNRSTQDRTALLVVGSDLASRLEPVDDLPLETTVAYIVSIGPGDDRLLGPTAGGTVLSADDVGGVLPAVDKMSVDLRNLYRAEVPGVASGASTLTLEIPGDSSDPARTTVALDPDSVRPVEAEPAEAPDPAGAPDAEGPPDTADTAGPVADPGDRVGLPLILAPLVIAIVVLAGLALLRAASNRRRRARRTSAELATDDRPLTTPEAPRGETPPRTTRPIAKLAPETREALAQAHLGLRRLAKTSRTLADHVPDDLFRLSEARASVDLGGRDVPLGAALAAGLSTGTPTGDLALVGRAATALSTGWQHTAMRKATPPPVVEINAVLTGRAPNGTTSRPQRPVAPVRALNPLVEIGLEHIVLAARTEPDSAMVARAVTTVDVGRAGRLPKPFLTLSPRLLQEAETYRAAVEADLNDPVERDRWLQLLCACVALAAADCADQVTRLDRLRARYREQADDARMLPLIDLLMARPVVDADVVRRQLSVSESAATQLLSDASDAGWLSPHGHLPDAVVAEQVTKLFRYSNDNREHDSQPALRKEARR